MNSSSKVVAFAAKASGAAHASTLSKQLKTTTTEHLQKLFQQMFDHLDDFLFDRADKGMASGDQNVYFEAMRHLRLKKQSMQDMFLAKFATGFNESIKGAQKTSSVNAFTKDALDNLLLVNDDELEESLAVSNMVAKARNLHKEQLFALEQRCKAIFNEGQEITAENLPVGPGVICNAFKGAAKILDVEVKVKLIAYKLLDRYLVQELGNCYYELNKLLAEAGVLPTIRLHVPQPSSGSTRARMPGATVPTGTSMPGSYTPTAYSSQPGTLPAEMFGTLQHLLMAQRNGSEHPSSGGFATNAPGNSGGAQNVGAYDTPTVLVALSALQNQPTTDLSELKGKDEIANYLKSTIVSHLSGTNPQGAKNINQTDADTIDIVTMLFDFILDDKSLPDAFKALIARLQIPVLKIAIVDKTFFSKKNHPVRRLLNELARAGIGWNEARDGYEDPLYVKVASVVNTVLTEFTHDASLIVDLLHDFDKFIEAEKSQRKLAAEKLASAKETVAHEIEKRISDVELPFSIRSFMTTAWKDVLTLIHTRDGNDGVAWKAALQLADNLVWSVQPKLIDKQRTRLIQTIPKILNGLQDGLMLIAYPRQDKERLLRELERLHLASLKGEQARATPTNIPLQKPGTNTPSPDQPKNTIDQLIDDLSTVPTLMEDIVLQDSSSTQPTEEAPGFDEYTDFVSGLKVGVWVEFLLENLKTVRGKLAWKSEVLGEYTFVDRMYKVVADKSTQELAADFRNMRASVVEEVPLLDRALDAVVKGLKRYSSGNASPDDNLEITELHTL